MRGYQHSSSQFNLLELVVVITVFICIASLLLPLAYKFIRTSKKLGCEDNLKQIGTWTSIYLDQNDNLLPSYEAGWVAALSETGNLAVDQESEPQGTLACPSQSFESYDPTGKLSPAEWWRGSYYGINQHITSSLRAANGAPLPYWHQAKVNSFRVPEEKFLFGDTTGGNFAGIAGRDPVIAGISRWGRTHAESFPTAAAPPFPNSRHLDGTVNIMYVDLHVEARSRWPQLMLGRGTPGFAAWHGEHWYPGLPKPGTAKPAPSDNDTNGSNGRNGNDTTQPPDPTGPTRDTPPDPTSPPPPEPIRDPIRQPDPTMPPAPAP